MKYIFCLMIMACTLLNGEESVKPGRYEIDIVATLDQQLSKSFPTMSSEEKNNRINATKDRFTELMKYIEITNGKARIIGKIPDVGSIYLFPRGELVIGNKTEIVVITDPDEQWKNEKGSLAVTAINGDRLSWHEQVGTVERTIIMMKSPE